MADITRPVTFLSLPAELRNQIYDLVITTPSPYTPYPPPDSTHPNRALSLSTFGRPSSLDIPSAPASSSSSTATSLLLTCRQLYSETHLLYYSRTLFSLSGPSATPSYFTRLLAPLSAPQIAHLKHLSITSRISHLRALNEQWTTHPFNNEALSLETLTVIPRRAHAAESHYAEVADLSQSHTLAYILAETLKTLRGVRRLIVRNDEACFNPVVWRLVYRSLVYRLWRWGGSLCGLSFRQDGSEREAWFEVLIGDKEGEDGDEGQWRDSWDEVNRLIGAEEKDGAAMAAP